MKHFTDKAWLVVYTSSRGYSRDYGIAGICNKPSEANALLEKLQKASIKKEEISFKIGKTFEVKEVTLSGDHELFSFEY